MYRGVKQAVLMVGGKGTRLRPLTLTRPKPILSVTDKPCLGYLIDSMVKGGIEEIILACGYKSELLVNAIGDGSDRGVKIRYSFEEEPMGTGGAIKLLEDELDDVFVAVNGDVFADFDLRGEIDTHIKNNADITLALTPVDNPWEFGTACQNDTGRIVEFREKPKPEDVISNLINAGVYIVNKEMIGFIPEGEMYDFSKDLVPKKTAEGYRIWGHTLEGIWMDVGRKNDLIRSNLVVAARDNIQAGEVKDSETVGILYSHATSSIESSKIYDASIMSECKILGSEIINSVIMPGAQIINSRIENSVIGYGAVIDNSNVIESIIGDNEILKDTEIRDFGGE